MAQLTITITYPDNNQIDFRDTFAIAFGYPTLVDDGLGGQIPNPQSKASFVQEKLKERAIRWMKEIYKIKKIVS